MKVGRIAVNNTHPLCTTIHPTKNYGRDDAKANDTLIGSIEQFYSRKQYEQSHELDVQSYITSHLSSCIMSSAPWARDVTAGSLGNRVPTNT